MRPRSGPPLLVLFSCVASPVSGPDRPFCDLKLTLFCRFHLIFLPPKPASGLCYPPRWFPFVANPFFKPLLVPAGGVSNPCSHGRPYDFSLQIFSSRSGVIFHRSLETQLPYFLSPHLCGLCARNPSSLPIPCSSTFLPWTQQSNFSLFFLSWTSVNSATVLRFDNGPRVTFEPRLLPFDQATEKFSSTCRRLYKVSFLRGTIEVNPRVQIAPPHHGTFFCLRFAPFNLISAIYLAFSSTDSWPKDFPV